MLVSHDRPGERPLVHNVSFERSGFGMFVIFFVPQLLKSSSVLPQFSADMVSGWLVNGLCNSLCLELLFRPATPFVFCTIW